MAYAALFVRMLLRGIKSGVYPRGGSVHTRLWCAERLVEASGAANISGAPWMIHFARALGAGIGRDVDLHTLPPVTGLLTVGDGASVEPEVDLAGWWIDGDQVRIGAIVIKPGATVGARSTLFPDTVVGRDAVVEPGSAVRGRVRAGQLWAGSPAVKVGKASHPWPPERPERHTRWAAIYALSALVLAAIPLLSLAAGLAVLGVAMWHDRILERLLVSRTLRACHERQLARRQRRWQDVPVPAAPPPPPPPRPDGSRAGEAGRSFTLDAAGGHAAGPASPLHSQFSRSPLRSASFQSSAGGVRRNHSQLASSAISRSRPAKVSP